MFKVFNCALSLKMVVADPRPSLKLLFGFPTDIFKVIGHMANSAGMSITKAVVDSGLISSTMSFFPK